MNQKMRFSVALALLAIFANSSINAADKEPASGAVIGTGGFSCGLFSKYDREPNNSAQMTVIVQWAWGFMSAYNSRALFSSTYQPHPAPRQISLPDEPTVLLYIRQHCDRQPLSNVTNATLDLIRSLGGVVTGTISFP
jgi:hypothetical protein